ncbi:MAG: GNAT family N-acetyltransferase [Chloroflexota bacterium]
MDVVIQPAAIHDQPTVRHLMQLYFYDMSEFTPQQVDNQGLYHHKYFDCYWSEPDHYPFVIRVGPRPAGFAFVRFVEDGVADVAEFFVLRGDRRKGVGKIAAGLLFDKFPGRWQVRQAPKNYAAQSFWRGVIQEYTGGDYQDLPQGSDDHEGPMQRFDSRLAAAREVRSAKEA